MAGSLARFLLDCNIIPLLPQKDLSLQHLELQLLKVVLLLSCRATVSWMVTLTRSCGRWRIGSLMSLLYPAYQSFVVGDFQRNFDYICVVIYFSQRDWKI